MRNAALLSAVAAVSFFGAFAFKASGGGPARGAALDVRAANVRTSHVSSVHYSVAVTLTQHRQPTTLHIDGGSSRDRLVAHLAIGAVTGSVLMSKPFLYEQAPSGMAALDGINWLRMRVSQLSPRSGTMSTLRSLTPAPLLHVIGEAKLRPVGATGVFVGPVAYDDPVVRTSLRLLAAGIEFRGLQMRVVVGRDGLVHRVQITGRTADGGTRMMLRARLFGFDAPVRVTPPGPGTFIDQDLQQLQS